MHVCSCADIGEQWRLLFPTPLYEFISSGRALLRYLRLLHECRLVWARCPTIAPPLTPTTMAVSSRCGASESKRRQGPPPRLGSWELGSQHKEPKRSYKARRKKERIGLGMQRTSSNAFKHYLTTCVFALRISDSICRSACALYTLPEFGTAWPNLSTNWTQIEQESPKSVTCGRCGPDFGQSRATFGPEIHQIWPTFSVQALQVETTS